MGTFSNNAITDNGRVLLSHVQMGAVFMPTKIIMGSGSLPPGTTVRTITAVVAPEQTLTIAKKKRGNDGTVTIGGVYSNQQVTMGFYFRELGLYAKAVYPDGQEVAEVLYSYGNAGSTADYMPAYSAGQPVEREIDLVVYIGNDTSVDLTIENGVYITEAQLEEALKDVGSGLVIIPQITIPATGWEAAAPVDGSEYAMTVDVTVQGVLENHVPAVALDVASLSVAEKCGLCPTVQSLVNTIRFWAREAPEMPLTATLSLFSEGGRSGNFGYTEGGRM